MTDTVTTHDHNDVDHPDQGVDVEPFPYLRVAIANVICLSGAILALIAGAAAFLSAKKFPEYTTILFLVAAFGVILVLGALAAGAFRREPVDPAGETDPEFLADDPGFVCDVDHDTVAEHIGAGPAAIVGMAREWTAEELDRVFEVWSWYADPEVYVAAHRVYESLKDYGYTDPDGRPGSLDFYMDEVSNLSAGIDVILVALYALDRQLITGRYSRILTKWWTDDLNLPLPERSANVEFSEKHRAAIADGQALVLAGQLEEVAAGAIRPDPEQQ